MARKKKRRIRAIPVSEGVRFEVGTAAAEAVRDERRCITVHVAQKSHFFRTFLRGIPLLRGIARLISVPLDMLSALDASSELEPQDTARGSKSLHHLARLFRVRPESVAAFFSVLWIVLILSAGMIGLPWVVEWAFLTYAPELPSMVANGFCAAFRVCGFLTAVWALTRLRLFRRTAMYRGAANKVLNAFQAYDTGLTFESVAVSSRVAPVSEGAFCAAVIVLAIIGNAFLPFYPAYTLALARLGVLLGSAALLNELLLPMERGDSESLGAWLLMPLNAVQMLFTLEPTNAMLEVALEAFKAAYGNDPD